MFYLRSAVERLAQKELNRREISGEVVGVRFVLDNGCPMIRIGFTADVKPTPVLTGFDYMEHKDDEYYLYLPIDITTSIK